MASSNAATPRGIGVGLPLLAGSILAIALIVLFFSEGSRPVEVDLTVTLRDGATKRPIAGCTVAFADAARGVGVTETDSNGMARGRVKRRENASSPLRPWSLDITLNARFHLGDPRQETWSVIVPFRRPVLLSTTTADVELASSPWVSDDEWSRPRASKISHADVRVSMRAEDGRTIYGVPLELFLEPAQVGHCASRAGG